MIHQTVLPYKLEVTRDTITLKKSKPTQNSPDNAKPACDVIVSRVTSNLYGNTVWCIIFFNLVGYGSRLLDAKPILPN